MKKLIVFIMVAIMVTMVGCGKESTSDEQRANYVGIEGTDFMYYINNTHEVIARSSSSKSGVATNMHYHNYILYYSPDDNVFYYYDFNDKIHTIKLDEILNDVR